MSQGPRKHKLIDVWQARNRILDGFLNAVFKKRYIEAIASRRLTICRSCDLIDYTGSKCYMPGTAPCCSLCGCKLAWKTRCLAESCDIKKWEAVLSDDEELQLKQELGITDDE